MRVIYNLSIRFLFAAIWIAQFFDPKAKKWISGRKGWKNKLPEIDENREVIWFHCASLGEFDQGLPLMNRLKEKKPSVFLLVTFFSPSGLEHFDKRKHQVDFACYLPADTKKNMRFLLEYLRPSKLFIVKYEFWCNLLFEAERKNVKIYSVCAIFRENQHFFKWYGAFFRKAIFCFERIFVQNPQSVTLLASISFKNVTLVGDMRFDRVIENKLHAEADSSIERFLNGAKAFIIGSSWPIDEEFLKEAVEKYTSTGKVIIAPHDISEKHLREIETKFTGKTVRYTQFEANLSGQEILIIDFIGKLSNAYSYGEFAYVGGGFTGKLHNILEPAVFGLPVIFGPKHKRFPEARLFLDEGIAFCVSNRQELESAIETIQSEKEEISVKTSSFVMRNKGVADNIMNLIV